jgi:hypothetical protein
MNPSTRRNFRHLGIVVVLVLVCLVFRRVFYAFELAALELRYFWWLFLILAVGLWLVSRIGKPDR